MRNPPHRLANLPIIEALARRCRAWLTLNELRALTDRELDDIGLVRSMLTPDLVTDPREAPADGMPIESRDPMWSRDRSRHAGPKLYLPIN